MTLAERLWSKVDVRGPDECWPFTGRHNQDGYGILWVGPTHASRRQVRAHRVAWELTNGPIADGLSALHHCDNPPCCNPVHLFLGTRPDNSADMQSKGRARNGTTRLTSEQVEEIRSRVARGERQKELAAEFGISKAQASQIVRGRRWR